MQQRIFLERALRLTDTKFHKLYPQSKRCYVDEDLLLEPILRNHDDNGAFTIASQNTPFLRDYADHIRGNMYKNYINKRDVYRSQVYERHNETNPDPTYWSKSSSATAGKIFSKIPKGVSRAFITQYGIGITQDSTGANVQIH